MHGGLARSDAGKTVPYTEDPSTQKVCCHDRAELVELLQDGQGCLTHSSIFKNQLLSEEGLTYTRLIMGSMIKNHEARSRYLEKEFTNNLKKTLYIETF